MFRAIDRLGALGRADEQGLTHGSKPRPGPESGGHVCPRWRRAPAARATGASQGAVDFSRISLSRRSGQRQRVGFFWPSAAAALWILLIPSCSPFSLSWQVRVTYSLAFTFLRLPAAASRTGAVMLAPESSLKVIDFPSTLTETTVPFMSCVLPMAAAGATWKSNIPAIRTATTKTATLVMAPP